MGRKGPFLAGVMLALALCLGHLSSANAGGIPEISSILEGRNPDDNAAVLVVNGQGMKSVRGGRLLDPGGNPAGTLGVISPGSTTVSLTLPPDLEPGPYSLILSYGKKKAPVEALPFPVSVAGEGVLPESVRDEAMHPDLLEDLDDAETMAGEPVSHYQDADHFTEGTLPTSLYSAMDDLVDEGHVVDGEFTTDLYSAWTDLEDEGIVSGGLLDTSRYSALKDLAAEGILDGFGDLHTDHYSAWADLVDEGYVTNGVFGPSLFSAWASFDEFGQVNADNELRPDLFDAYADLGEESRIGDGANQVAEGDHDHDDAYVKLSGDSLVTARVDIDLAGAHTAITQPLVWVQSSKAGTVALLADVANVNGSYQILGQVDSTGGGYGVYAHHTGATGKGYGIKAVNNASGFAALEAGMGGGQALSGVKGLAKSPDGFGIFAISDARCAHIADFEHPDDLDPDRARVILEAAHTGTSGDLAVFQAGTSNVARIDRAGKGYFNGGIQTSGADFAERVDVDRSEEQFEAGDVVVIDVDATRGFRLSTERESRLVAGVVSATPGVLATPDPVATVGAKKKERRVNLGIVGIVPVKVTDENGPIRPGDLLVTASKAGHAMRAPEKPRTGTLLGKALGSLEKGEGQVEVLLRLK